MIALIDGDILLYRIGFTTEQEPEGIARVRTDDLVDSILMETDAKEFEVWLSDNKDNNFRFEISADYKANRVQPRPKHYEVIKEHLVKEWGAKFAFGMEADDAMGIQQVKYFLDDPEFGATPHDCVICSIDKDLLQIPGQHYNFVKKEWQTVTIWEGLQWFYKQILIGDKSDNVKGCKGIGPVKAGKAIDPIGSEKGERALFEKVVEVYQGQEGKTRSSEEILNHILLAGRLLKIKQKQDEELWHFPKSPQTTDTLVSSSTAPTLEAPTQFTEPTTLERNTVG
jgi:5'-3' exonuclease